jgi:hypothetical protein
MCARVDMTAIAEPTDPTDRRIAESTDRRIGESPNRSIGEHHDPSSRARARNLGSPGSRTLYDTAHNSAVLAGTTHYGRIG